MGRSGGRRILLTTVGSLGDLHPYLALGVELRRRGHEPVIGSVEAFRTHVTAAGLRFCAIRALSTELPGPELMRQVFRGRKGLEYILRTLVMPALRTAYEDTLAAAEGMDLLIGHALTMATPLVAAVRGIPWISTQLAPIGLLSAFDPPVLPGLPWVHRLHPTPASYRLFYRVADRQVRRLVRPFDGLRSDLRLPDTGNPLFAGGHSPLRELALFSPLFGPPQADWPAQTRATGFPFFEQPVPPDPVLEAFLETGPPPIVFTLGSSAVMDPGDFFRVSAEAAEQLGRRALLLGIEDGALQTKDVDAGAEARTADLLGVRYGSYARIFPSAAAIVHQGGVGTTAEALRAGRPMLVVPWGVDQPDNAARVARMGVGRTLGRKRYRTARVVEELRRLLEEATYARRAAEVGAAIRQEEGTETACDAIEAVMEGARADAARG